MHSLPIATFSSPRVHGMHEVHDVNRIIDTSTKGKGVLISDTIMDDEPIEEAETDVVMIPFDASNKRMDRGCAIFKGWASEFK